MNNHSKIVINAADSTAESGSTRQGTTRRQQNRRLTRSSFIRFNAQPDNQFDNHDDNTDGNNNTKVTSSKEFLGGPSPQASSANDDDEFDYLGRPPLREPMESNSSRSSTPPAAPPAAAPKNRRKQNAPKKRKEQVYKEIKRLQYPTNLLIPRLQFQRAVREVLQSYKNDFRMQKSSLECIQEAAESYLVQLFEDSYLCTRYRMLKSLEGKDINLVKVLRGPYYVGNRQ